MSVANHEVARLLFPGGTAYSFDGTTYDMQNKNGTAHDNVIGEDIPDLAYQSATVTSRTNNPTIAAIGYRGVAAISDLIGTVELSLEGILLWSPKASAGAPGYATQANASAAKGLLGKDLYDYVSIWGGAVIETRGQDAGDVGKACCIHGMYLSSISYNFAQNANVTNSWSFTAYDCVWANSSSITPTTGTGTNFDPITSKDLDIDVIFPAAFGSAVVDNVQSVQFSANINRDEVFRIGSKAPFDRPVRFPFEVTANLEVLADTASMLNMYTPDFEWNTGDANNPNKIEIYVYLKAAKTGSNDYKICGAPYQRPVDGSLRMSVGANSTVTLNTTGWLFEF